MATSLSETDRDAFWNPDLGSETSSSSTSSSSSTLAGQTVQRQPSNNPKIEQLRTEILAGPNCTLKQYLDEGYEIAEVGKGYILRGEKVADVKLVKKIEDSTGMKVVRFIAGAAAGPLSAIKAIKDKTWNPLINNQIEDTVFVKEKNDTDPENIDELTEKLGYDISDSASIKAYVESLTKPSHKNYNPSMVENIEGNLVVRELRRPGISSFILIPGGNFEKAHVRKFWNAKTGASITDPKEAYRAIRAIIVAVTSPQVKKEFRKLCLAKAKLQFEQLTDEKKAAVNQDKWIEDMAKMIRKSQRSSVIDTTFHCVTFFGERDVNDNHSKGTMVTLSEADEKQLKEIYKLESKGKLEGEQPFKNPPSVPSSQEEETK